MRAVSFQKPSRQFPRGNKSGDFWNGIVFDTASPGNRRSLMRPTTKAGAT
jgi:hypothetical protein